jgi:hypothetical protein
VQQAYLRKIGIEFFGQDHRNRGRRPAPSRPAASPAWSRRRY